VKAAMVQAPKRHEATFTTDYVAHMQMEPMNCVVRFADGAYDIYTGSQFQTFAAGTLAATLGVDPSKIRIHQQYLGGGFGRRLEPDIMVETALIAREVKRPVKLIRSREEDLRRDFYRSATSGRWRRTTPASRSRPSSTSWRVWPASTRWSTGCRCCAAPPGSPAS